MKSLFNKLKRFWQIGPTKICWLLYHRWRKKRFIARMRRGQSFELKQSTDIEKNQLVQSLFLSSEQRCYPETSSGSIPIIGYGTYTYKNVHAIDWHSDMFCKMPSPASWKNTFFADITIPEHAALHNNGPLAKSICQSLILSDTPHPSIHFAAQNTQDERGRVSKGGVTHQLCENPNAWQPDIKVPWELSRMHHLILQKNASDFQQQLDSWIVNNPFPFGVNWINPMEIAIRSINILFSMMHFKDDKTITFDWWDKIAHTLLCHAVFVEHNFEVSSKPNNHYLADLVGYVYLCAFFSADKIWHKKMLKTLKTIETSFAEQILPDGTAYEGSTAYHRLDTELLGLVIDLCTCMKILVSNKLENLYAQMLEFVDDCSDGYGTFVTIGDDDGGRVTLGSSYPFDFARLNALRSGRTENEIVSIATKKTDKDTVRPERNEPPGECSRTGTNGYKTYPNFGLTIIKNKNWHITFRHPTYTHKQPTGHFHQDALAITAVWQGLQLLCDPGSYVYTSNACWRNMFRSAQYHNTFFTGHAKLPTSLFQLNRIEHTHHATFQQISNMIFIADWTTMNSNIQAHRRLDVGETQNMFTVTDWCETIQNNNSLLTWTWHIGPGLGIEKMEKNKWYIKKEKRIIALILWNLDAEVQESFYAPTYGIKMPTQTLVASALVHTKSTFSLRIMDHD